MDKRTEQLISLQELESFFSPDTAAGGYLLWLRERMSKPDALYESYRPIIQQSQEQAPEQRPFLTIVMRTQGKRQEMLTEALLSLTGQTDEDFEIVLIGHKVEPSQKPVVRSMLEELPTSLRAKIRYYELETGNRTTPLNLGFSYAHGMYVSVLDDDDIVFDNWVEAFHQAAREHPGTVIHAYVLTQDWRTVTTPDGRLALRAEAAPDDMYCRDFVMIHQLERNWCPLMGLAFPAELFQRYGIVFDETLSTTEDWDFLVRTASIAGATDVQHPTSIYRIWENAENSKTLHQQKEWEENYDRIQRRFSAMPIVLPGEQDKRYKIVVVEQRSLRIALKEKIHRYIPKPVWFVAKKMYRLLGGKKWLG